MSASIILVHGLGLWGLEFLGLQKRLKNLGYQPIIVRYSPWRNTIDECAAQVYAQIPKNTPEIFIVAHSLGGLVVAQMKKLYPEVPLQNLLQLLLLFDGAKLLMTY